MNKILPLTTFLCLVSLYSTAQTVCTQTLRQARTVYDEGRIHEIPALLESCLKNGFTDDEKTEAYRLLALAYLYLDESVKADEVMLALLRHNNQFQINPQADPAELINLYNSFRTNPIFSYGVKGGGNVSLVNITSNYGVHDQRITMGKYTPAPGYIIGGMIEVIFKKNLTLSGELTLAGYYLDYSNAFSNVDSINRFIEYQDITETQTCIALPVTVQYQFAQGKLNPYVLLGGSANYLLSSSFKGETQTSIENFKGATVSLLDQRNKINFSAIAGAGIKIKVGKNHFIAEARFNYGILNQVKEENRLKNQELIFDYGYVDNDFKLNSISISLGYLLPKYNPKKLN
ncbi:PorT family protein [Fulvivirga sp. 29W222]|uniref:PorT family protein n=1 Tax=Fulvivirga marina TaxID=2494733 RepID=A0A937FVS3_9BACT|nr:porin family protein [Fulvivirga marina]MBL6445903.1 PorT family protein [Fulvivirga marina]